MRFITVLLTFALWSQSGQASQNDENWYGASVTFDHGRCWFWTGDQGFNSREFREDLADRFDLHMGVLITYNANTPSRCIRRAITSAKQAGFKRVKAVASVEAGPIAPPGIGGK